MTSSTTADDLSSHRTRTNVRRPASSTVTPAVALAETVVAEATDRELIGA
jgi:hypothetical protein